MTLEPAPSRIDSDQLSQEATATKSAVWKVKSWTVSNQITAGHQKENTT